MSKLTKNGKNLILENTIVSYSPKDDTIHIASADPDLYGEPFHISLNQSSQTENTLRALLIEQGVIKEDIIGTNLPETLTIPETFNEDHNVFDLGVSRHGIVSWEPAKDSHLGIYGYTGSGKTVVANNILFQALKNQDIWDVYCFDPTRVEYSHAKKHLNNPDNYADNRDSALAIMENLFKSFKSRVDQFTKNETIKPVILFIDEIVAWIDSVSREDDEYKELFISYLTKILREGRSFQIYVVFTSQSPDLLDEVIQNSFPSSITMGRSNENMSKIALGSNVAVRTPRVKGRGYFKFGNVEPAQFQSYWTPVSKFDEIPDKN